MFFWENVSQATWYQHLIVSSAAPTLRSKRNGDNYQQLWCWSAQANQSLEHNEINKGRNPKKISTKIVNMSLSPLTPLPLKAIGNKKIVNYGTEFNSPTFCRDREKWKELGIQTDRFFTWDKLELSLHTSSFIPRKTLFDFFSIPRLKSGPKKNFFLGNSAIDPPSIEIIFPISQKKCLGNFCNPPFLW